MMQLSELKVNPRNPQIFNDLDSLKKSIEQFPKMMTLRPLVYDPETMFVLGGNKRRVCLEELGYKEIPDEWVKSAADLTEEEKKRFIVQDNIQVGEFDFEILAADYEEDELEEWGLELPEDFEQQSAAEEDNYEIPDEIKTDIVLGDLIEIGVHRLLCGDSTDSEHVAKVMNGNKWDITVTSPPYNQGNGSGDLLTNGKKTVRLYNDKNADNKTKSEYFDFLISVLNNMSFFKNEKHTVCWNVSYNAKSRDDYGKILFSDKNPFGIKETIIWDKGHSINLPQIGIYSRRCEFVFIMSDNEKYKTTQKYNDSRWNYLQISSMNTQITGDKIEHRASYPVEFVSKMITDFSFEKDIVLDPFIGSGSTMVAAHQLNRKCYGMELDPKYCQVIIDRMHKLDPDLPIKINGKIQDYAIS